jgi:hypothetical protein
MTKGQLKTPVLFWEEMTRLSAFLPQIQLLLISLWEMDLNRLSSSSSFHLQA